MEEANMPSVMMANIQEEANMLSNILADIQGGDLQNPSGLGEILKQSISVIKSVLDFSLFLTTFNILDI